MRQFRAFNLFTALLSALLFVSLYLLNFESMQKFNNNFLDMFFNIRGETVASKEIVIVDIDERSLAALGRWPWRRDKVAELLDSLRAYGVGMIGFDMVFAESDGSSPKKIVQELGLNIPNAVDYDEIFSNSIADAPVVLGYVFNMENNFTNHTPDVGGLFIEHGKGNQTYIPVAKGATSNIQTLSKSANFSGSFNMIPDADGVVRHVPMLFSLQDAIFPSLSLEMIRAALGVQKVSIHYSELGVEEIVIGDVTIPTDENGRLFVNFAGGEGSYTYLSALDVLEQKIQKEALEGKIVLIGTSASGLLDLRATPFDKKIPGVEIHANAIDNILNGNFLQKPTNAVGINALIIFFSTLLVALWLGTKSVAKSAILALVYIAALVMGLYMLIIGYGVMVNIIYPLIAVFTTTLILFVSKLFTESRQKEQILNKFAKKVSPAVAQTLIKAGNVDFSAMSKEVTIFFSDIRDFTTISEGFEDAKALIAYLNRYMAPMSEVIIKNKGTIDKYIGDAVMAYWNAPLDVEDHADAAVQSALEQLEKLEMLNKALGEQNLPHIRIGIGIHTGEAVVGEMGSTDRSDYTIIGDSVNIASRVEGLCKMYGAEILITEQTKRRLKQNYELEEIGSVMVKGKKEPVLIYKVLRGGA